MRKNVSQSAQCVYNAFFRISDGLPRDFSILTTFRAAQKSKSVLFTIYSAEGEEILSLKIARRLRLMYQGQLDKDSHRVKFRPNLVDGK